MSARLSLVGADAENAATLEASFKRFALALNAHLTDHLFIFGGRPSVADFALAAQVQQLLMDPTPAAWLKAHTPFVIAWCENMDDPKAGSPFEDLSALAPTLAPLFEGEVARTYLPWAKANAASASRNRKRFSVTLPDGMFEQSTQSYAARAFASVRKAVRDNQDNDALKAFLTETGSYDAFDKR